jgi:uncharacterized protein
VSSTRFIEKGWMMIDDVKGIAFPFAIDPSSGRIAVASGREKIRQDLRILLSIRVGERPMLRDYGTRIPSLVHDINDGIRADIAQNQTAQAIQRWEPRVLLMESQVEQHEGELKLRLRYIFVEEPFKSAADSSDDELILPIG